MASYVNPFDRKKAPVPPTVDPVKQAELLARAKGRPPGPGITTPLPAAKLPTGITGNPPLPTGKIVGQIAPSSLTEIERSTLLASGWTPDIALPSSQEGLKQLQQAIADQQSVDVPLPVDPRTPPLKVNTIPIEQLPVAQQQQMRSAINDTIKGISQQEAQAGAAAKRTSDLLTREASVKGISQASGAADAAIESFRRRMAKETETPLDTTPEIVAVNPAAVQAMETHNHFAERTAPTPEPQPAPPPPPEAPPHSETGVAGVRLTHCPHCQWDLGIPDIPEPPYADKMSFLHSMIGDKPFVKEYNLFGGTVHAIFRTLTTREIDVIYRQAYSDRQEGKVLNEIDYWERLNRYRLMLQLQAFRSEGSGGFHKDLPDGYSESTNAHGSKFWLTPEQEKNLAQSETALPTIESWMGDEVMRTEAIFRVVNNACNQFNRLVAKMEAMADDTDFWKPTEEPS